MDEGSAGWTPRPDPGPAVLAEVPDLAPLLRAALRKRVPPAMRGGRVHLSWAAVAALALVVALAVAGGAVLVLRGRAGPVAADQPLPTSSDFTPAAAGTVPVVTPTTSGVVVEVVGRVHHAGVFSLPLGSRIIDALKAAGGALPGTDTTSLGLAQKLSDGEQVRVGIGGVAPGPAATGESGADASGPVDLNTATATQLDALPGVGPVLAQRIIAWRTAHGSFSSTSDLKQVQGLSGKKGDDLIALVSVG